MPGSRRRRLCCNERPCRIPVFPHCFRSLPGKVVVSSFRFRSGEVPDRRRGAGNLMKKRNKRLDESGMRRYFTGLWFYLFQQIQKRRFLLWRLKLTKRNASDAKPAQAPARLRRFPWLTGKRTWMMANALTAAPALANALRKRSPSNRHFESENRNPATGSGFFCFSFQIALD